MENNKRFNNGVLNFNPSKNKSNSKFYSNNDQNIISDISSIAKNKMIHDSRLDRKSNNTEQNNSRLKPRGEKDTQLEKAKSSLKINETKEDKHDKFDKYSLEYKKKYNLNSVNFSDKNHTQEGFEIDDVFNDI